MWLDDCRIPFVDETDKVSAKPIGKITTGTKENVRFNYTDDKTRHELPNKQNPLGRFTPNLLVCDDMLNDGVVTKQSKRTYRPTGNMGSLFGNVSQANGVGIGDSGSSSRYYDLDLWFEIMLERL
jgi:hypothetical protein